MKQKTLKYHDFIVPQSYARFFRQRLYRELIGIDLRRFNVTRFGYPMSLVIEQLCDSPGRYTLDQVVVTAAEMTGEKWNHTVILDELNKSDLFTTASASCLWPNLSLVLRYALRNILYRMKLTLFGRQAFSHTISAASSTGHYQRRIGVEMPFGLSTHLAAARLACAFPCVSPDPLVSSVSLARILRKAGYDAEVITGRQSGHYGIYHWVQVDGIILDVADSELDLEPLFTNDV